MSTKFLKCQLKIYGNYPNCLKTFARRGVNYRKKMLLCGKADYATACYDDASCSCSSSRNLKQFTPSILAHGVTGVQHKIK